jgi:hypothetical protein
MSVVVPHENSGQASDDHIINFLLLEKIRQNL